MQFRYHKKIARFMDISVIIHLQAAWPDFLAVFDANYPFLRRNGLEVIVVIQDEQLRPLASTLPDLYPAINWRIIMSNSLPGNEVNLALYYVSQNYILLLPDTVTLNTDVVYQLRYFTYHYANSFAVAPDTINTSNHGFTCLLAERTALTAIGGFVIEENIFITITKTGQQLQLTGKRQLIVPEALTSPMKAGSPLLPAYPVGAMPANHTIIFNWTTDKQESHISHVLSRFTEYTISKHANFKKDYRLICLIQVRNEIAHLPEVLLHLDKYCDGIILLDDGSDDGSYEHAFSEKLLLKVRKKYKGYFDDLENRNLLLQVGHLFKTQWFFFADADERFDSRSVNLFEICKKPDIDTVSFTMVHLWDHPDKYLKDLPEGKNGLFRRYRMFKNFGYMQIESNREIHFAAIPYIRNRYNAPVLVLHSGIIDEQKRKSKYVHYTKADEEGKKQGYRYEFLLAENAQSGNINDIRITP
jgi:hypothetical protein